MKKLSIVAFLAILSAVQGSVHGQGRTLGKMFVKASPAIVDGKEFPDREREDSVVDVKKYVPTKYENNKFVLAESEEDADYLLVVVERSRASTRKIELRGTISFKENGQWKPGTRLTGLANNVWRVAAENLVNDAAKWVRAQNK